MTDFIGVDDLATFMSADASSLDAALASLAISAAQAVVRNYLGQTITHVTDDDVFLDGTGKPWLRLPQRPVISVESVTENGTSVSTDDYLLRDAYLLRADRHSRWCMGNRNIEVVYTHGYDTAALDSDTSDSDFDATHVPADISLVALILARRFYEKAQTGEQGILRSETIGSYSYTLESSAAGSEMLDAERAVLDSYRVEGYR